MQLRSQRGQMALFIALIFQVLFVFFAMIINVGLIVHDKINLQNSVDLAAYYAAQRQAEMLNAIGHYNYQIRQAWKLLTFRYRVLGDLGFKQHPIQQPGVNFPDIAAYEDGGRPPNVCVNHSFWGFNQNLCYNTEINIPPIPRLTIINPFLPFNFVAQGLIDQFRDQAGLDCNGTASLNFNMLIKWLLAYRAQISQSKMAIRKYADILSSDPNNFLDIRGESVAEGVQKTLRENLTRTNLAGIVEDNFRMFNSLGQTGDRKAWLNEVLITPRILYTFTREDGGCKGIAIPIDGQGALPVGSPPNGYPGPGSPPPAVEFARKESSAEDYLYHSSFGFEKNPWVMAYVGVYAETEPRKPFLPFGKPIKLTARAYAKPFGGRVGPWFFKQWPRGSRKSNGNQFTQTDLVMPTSFDPADEEFSESTNIFPNYARFPGDLLGLRSRAALAVLKKGLINYLTGAGATSSAPQPLSVAFYEEMPGGLAGVPSTGGGVPSVGLMLGYNGPWIRDFEAAAISPDLFDAMYYSVEPNAMGNYITPGAQKIFQNQDLPYDLGSLPPQFPVGIKKQIEVLEQLKSEDTSMNFYLINDWKNLLTGWAPSGAYEYDFPQGVYAQCEQEGQIPIPGTCAVGGRAGYSVKIISRNYLTSEELSLGGPGQVGPIQNPPPF